MEDRSDNLISRKTFLKYGATAGLFFSVPYRNGLQELTDSVRLSDGKRLQGDSIGGNSGIGIHGKPDFVDVYYDFDPELQPKEVLANIEGAKGFWETAEKARQRLVCETGRYKAIANLEQPGVDVLYLNKG